MAVKNLSLVLSAGGTVAGSLPRTFNRAAREVQRLRDRQLEVRTELRKQQGALKRTSEGTVEYARTSSEVDRLKQSLADMGVQQRDAELSSRRFNQNLGRAKGLLLGVGGAAGVALTGIVALGKVHRQHRPGDPQPEPGGHRFGRGPGAAEPKYSSQYDGHGRQPRRGGEHRSGPGGSLQAAAAAEARHRPGGRVPDRHLRLQPYEASSLGAQELDTHVLQLIRDLQQQDNVAGLAALEQQLGAGAFAGYLAQAQKVPGRLRRSTPRPPRHPEADRGGPTPPPTWPKNRASWATPTGPPRRPCSASPTSRPPRAWRGSPRDCRRCPMASTRSGGRTKG